ncbi:hypothetical protein HY994_05670 [Candidatus Micrarchaeota archaeon]|nr:hypothetical protein [Candidatus Micrarchaeota archaeon]
MPSPAVAVNNVWNSPFNFQVYTVNFDFEDEQTATQLVPGAVFYIPLEKEATVRPTYDGNLKDLITEENIITYAGQFYYRIKVDINKAKIKATNSRIELTQYSVVVAFEDTNAQLTLKVENTPLSTFDPQSGVYTTDLSMQAAKGKNGNWVIVNNLALPNVLKCGTTAIEIPANSYKLVPATSDSMLEQCLGAISTEIIPAATCDQWNYAQTSFKEEIIRAYKNSLPAQVPYSNYEDFFGNANAKTFRPATLDTYQPKGTSPSCKPALQTDDLMVVQFDGDLMSEVQSSYDPQITQIPVIG